MSAIFHLEWFECIEFVSFGICVLFYNLVGTSFCSIDYDVAVLVWAFWLNFSLGSWYNHTNALFCMHLEYIFYVCLSWIHTKFRLLQIAFLTQQINKHFFLFWLNNNIQQQLKKKNITNQSETCSYQWHSQN